MFTVAKRASQLVTHIVIGFAVATALSGSLLLGGMAVLLEPLIIVLVLPLHEHAWAARRARALSDRARHAVRGAEKVSQTILHMLVAFAVMFGLTGSSAFGGIAALVEPLCNVLLMPFHDRFWEHLQLKQARPLAIAAE